MGGLNGGLGVELGRVRDLEEDVLHAVGGVALLELEWLGLEEDVVEVPGLGDSDPMYVSLALLDEVENENRRLRRSLVEEQAPARLYVL
jgi:hypothetical protein